MSEASRSREHRRQLVEDALAAVAEEHPVVVSIGWTQPFGDLLPFVVEIVARLPVLADKRDHIEGKSGLILEAYVSGSWQVRQETLARGGDVELPRLQAALEAVRAALAELSDKTRADFNQDLARRLWHGIRRRAALGAFALPGLEHTADQFDLQAVVLGGDHHLLDEAAQTGERRLAFFRLRQGRMEITDLAGMDLGQLGV